MPEDHHRPVAPTGTLALVLAPVVAAVLVLVAACGGGTGQDDGGSADQGPVPEFLVEELGGTTSAREFRGRPFHQSARSLNNSEFARFGRGAVVFDQHMTPDQGLGPTFNEDSCLSCHVDEAVNNPADPLEPGPGLLLRLSVEGDTPNGAPAMEPTYGLQLQTSAVRGAVPEGRLDIEWEAVAGRYPDGTRYELRRPVLRVTDLAAGPFAAGTMTSLRVAPPMVGLGLLEAIPATALRAATDPDDEDGDGISGRVNTVWDSLAQAPALGRFGWKAGQPTVRLQSAGALHDDMGVTSPDVVDPCANQGTLCVEPTGPPEMSATDLADQVFYNRTIAVPIARGVREPAVVRGARRFLDVGCASCHTPTQQSGPDEVAGLADQTFHPFTDLLLHDMGPDLADGRPEFDASGSEWRTPPLWGLGRRAEVTGSATLLHDGRARSAEEAVLWHGGEAAAARTAFMALSKRERADLLAFLAAL